MRRSAKVLDPASFGARGAGDGDDRDRRALQRALDAAGRGPAGTVVISRGRRGVYRMGQALHVPAKVRIICEPGVTIERMMPPGGGVVLRGDDGAEDIAVEGGSWVGGLWFARSTGLRLEGLTVRNDGYAITLDGAERFLLRDIHLDQRGEREVNQDGIHLFGPAHDGRIVNVTGRTFDDMVALNADDNDGRHGPIEAVTVDGLHADDTYNFVRIMSRGSLVDRICIRDVSGNSRVNGGFDVSSHRFPEVGRFGRLRFEGIHLSNHGNVEHPTFKLRGDIDSVHLRDVTRAGAPPIPLVHVARGTVGVAMLSGIVAAATVPLVIVDSRVEHLVICGGVFGRPGGAHGPMIACRDGAIGKLETIGVTPGRENVAGGPRPEPPGDQVDS